MIPNEIIMACKRLLIQSDNVDLLMYSLSGILTEDGEEMSDIVSCFPQG